MKTNLKSMPIKKLLIAVLAAVMIGTTAVSFAFWVNDIATENARRNLTVTIGKGGSVHAELTAGVNALVGSGLDLVPNTLLAADVKSSQTQAYIYQFEVKWAPESSAVIAESTASLAVRLSSIAVNLDTALPFQTGENGQLVQVTGMFTVAQQSILSAADFDLNAAAKYSFTAAPQVMPHIVNVEFDGTNAYTVGYVYIMIQLDEPKDMAQYEAIATNAITMTFDFILSDVTIVTH